MTETIPERPKPTPSPHYSWHQSFLPLPLFTPLGWGAESSAPANISFHRAYGRSWLRPCGQGARRQTLADRSRLHKQPRAVSSEGSDQPLPRRAVLRSESVRPVLAASSVEGGAWNRRRRTGLRALLLAAGRAADRTQGPLLRLCHGWWTCGPSWRSRLMTLKRGRLAVTRC